jgi:hypothetical protein
VNKALEERNWSARRLSPSLSHEHPWPKSLPLLPEQQQLQGQTASFARR